MEVIITLRKGAVEFNADGKCGKILRALRKTNVYLMDDVPVRFRQVEELAVASDGASNQVELITEQGGTLILEVVNDTIVARPKTGHSKITALVTRQAVDSCARQIIQIEVDNWMFMPEMKFKTKLQYDTFIEQQGEDVGEILDYLYTSHQSTENVIKASRFELIQSGEFAGQLAIRRADGKLVVLELDNDGAVYWSDNVLSPEKAWPYISMDLRYGQKENQQITIKGKTAVKDPRVADVQVELRDWIPRSGQMVRLKEGDDTVYFVDGYDQEKNRFFLIIADPKLRKADMEKKGRQESMLYSADPNKLLPVRFKL